MPSNSTERITERSTVRYAAFLRHELEVIPKTHKLHAAYRKQLDQLEPRLGPKSRKRAARLTRTAALTILAMLALAATASAHKPHKHKCPAHTIAKTKIVKRHGHKTRERVCVHATPRKPIVIHVPAQPGQPVPLAKAPAPKTTRLHAHVDPTFTQNPTDPADVTYAYSASASETDALVLGAEDPTPELPEGLLNLYSNGKLACSMTVAGSTEGGECPVTYTHFGEQTITTTYTSGAASATETETVTINPGATTTTLTATTATCDESTTVYEWEFGGKHEELPITDQWCSYTLTPKSTTAAGGTDETTVSPADGVTMLTGSGTLTVAGTAPVILERLSYTENDERWQLCQAAPGSTPVGVVLEQPNPHLGHAWSQDACGSTLEATTRLHVFPPMTGGEAPWVGSSSAPVTLAFPAAQ